MLSESPSLLHGTLRLDMAAVAGSIVLNRMQNQRSQSLEDLISERFDVSKYGDEREEFYLPEGQLDDLITEATIAEQLPSDYPGMGELIQFIVQWAQKTFAITLLTGLGGHELCDAITGLCRAGITDQSLPLLSPVSQPAFAKSPWSRWKIEQFRKNQWRFLAPSSLQTGSSTTSSGNGFCRLWVWAVESGKARSGVSIRSGCMRLIGGVLRFWLEERKQPSPSKKSFPEAQAIPTTQ
jgi:hypothetical protein